MSQWVNPRAVRTVQFANQFQAPAELPDNACGCWAGRQRRWGTAPRPRRRFAATVFVGTGDKLYAVPCSRCGGTGVAT